MAPTYAYPSPQYYTAPAYQPAPPPPRPYYYVQQPEPPSYSLPPLPPGYVYMPVPIQQQTQVAPPAAAVADGARREQLYEELRRTDLRLSELQRQHIGVGGPITLMVLGYGTTMVSGLVALSSYNAADRIKRGNYSYEYDDELDVNNDGAINYRDSRKLRRMGRIALGVGAASLFVGISATVRLAKRRAERSKRAQELRSLTAERDGLRRQLDFGPALGAGHVGVRFQGRY